MERVLLRSNAMWIAEGEKITKYFCSPRKRNFVSKRMTKLVNKNGLTLEEPNEIASEVKCFYDTLYKSREVDDCEINDLINEIPKLSQEEQTTLEGEITLGEAGIALKNMKNGKIPESYGFGTELLKSSWKQTGDLLLAL